MLKSQKRTYIRMWEIYDAPVFDTDLGLGLVFAIARKNITSYIDKYWFYYYENGIGSMYYTKEEMILAGEYGYKDFTSPRYFEKYLRKSKYYLKKTSNISRTLNNKKLSKFSDKELLKIFVESGKTLMMLFALFNTVQPQCMKKIEDEVNKYLFQKIKKNNQEIFSQLTVSHKINTLQQEQRDWLKIVIKYKKAQKINQAIRNSVINHADRYGILGTADGSQAWDYSYYRKLLEKDSKKSNTSLREKLKIYEIFSKKILKGKNNIYKRYNISNRIKRLVEMLSELGYIRLEIRLSGWMVFYYYFKNIFFPEISKRTGLPVYLLRAMTYDEVISFLKEGKNPSNVELKRRNSRFVMGMEEGKLFLLSGIRAKNYKEKKVKDIDFKKVIELKGQVAMKGKVRGKVIVLKWGDKDLLHKMKKMKKGSILVAGQTRPNLMLAIRKAGAIITDEGGITSHAAVVSRELGVPGIIGTKYATSVLNDGDEVYVNAEKGTINILNRLKK